MPRYPIRNALRVRSDVRSGSIWCRHICPDQTKGSKGISTSPELDIRVHELLLTFWDASSPSAEDHGKRQIFMTSVSTSILQCTEECQWLGLYKYHSVKLATEC